MSTSMKLWHVIRCVAFYKIYRVLRAVMSAGPLKNYKTLLTLIALGAGTVIYKAVSHAIDKLISKLFGYEMLTTCD